MAQALHSDYQTDIGAFHAFMRDRPAWEKWELIDGELIVHATPTKRHQLITGNLLFELETIKRGVTASWLALIGIGTRLPGDSRNEIVPDLMVLPRASDASNWTYHVLAAFEVLSPDSLRRDMIRKPDFYTRIDSLTHYVVLAQDRIEATIFARSDAFSPKTLAAGDRIEIAPLGISLPLAEIYRDVPLG